MKTDEIEKDVHVRNVFIRQSDHVRQLNSIHEAAKTPAFDILIIQLQ